VLTRPARLGIPVLLVLALAACSDGPTAPAAASGTEITVSVSRCGAGWTDVSPGQKHFVLHNTDTRAGEVLLTDASTAAVYAEVEPVGPGSTANLDIALGSGRYTFRCAMEDEATVVGPAVTVPGHVRRPVEPVSAVTQADLITATKAYQDYVRGQIPVLVRLTTSLRGRIAARDLPGARRAWLPAHLEYERLGAAYDAFGDLDGEINGLPSGLPGGVHDPDWAGFHRIEYGLWHGSSAAALLGPAGALLTAVRRLGGDFASAQIDPLVLSIRAHEIAENALEFELTGRSDFGSGSGLATVSANLDGTRTVLGIIRPLLTSRYAALGVVQSMLTRTSADLAVLHPSSRAVWPALSSLSTRDRELLDADLSRLTELLAPIASILEPRRAS
jgi:iron uptake system component EfeO